MQGDLRPATKSLIFLSTAKQIFPSINELNGSDARPEIHYKEPIPKIKRKIFPENELRGHSPNFHIHVSVSDLYIPTIDLPILLHEICGLCLSFVNRSQTHECGNWD
jgi:hypothetical protein